MSARTSPSNPCRTFFAAKKELFSLCYRPRVFDVLRCLPSHVSRFALAEIAEAQEDTVICPADEVDFYEFHVTDDLLDMFQADSGVGIPMFGGISTDPAEIASTHSRLFPQRVARRRRRHESLRNGGERRSARLAATADKSFSAPPVPVTGVKEEAGAARYCLFEAPPYRELRRRPFNEDELAELRAKYLRAPTNNKRRRSTSTRRQDVSEAANEVLALRENKAPADVSSPEVAAVIREALSAGDKEGALVLLRQMAFLDVHPVALGHPRPPWGRSAK